MAIQTRLYSENLGLRFAMGSPQDLFMDNAAGLINHSFIIPQQQQQQQQLMQFDQFQNSSHQKNHNFLLDNATPCPSKNTINDHQSIGFDQNLSAQIEKQRMEIDRFISLQNERLKQALQEQRKRQITLIMSKCESKIQCLLNQKDEEILKASNRKTELENILKRMEIENQTWQRVVKEKEAIVASLNSKIERLRKTACLSINAVEDAESCCQGNEKEGEKNRVSAENEEQITRKMVCRCCNSRNSCVIMLPCRHLCSCKDCEIFLDSCPVCRMVKKASIEASIQ